MRDETDRLGAYWSSKDKNPRGVFNRDPKSRALKQTMGRTMSKTEERAWVVWACWRGEDCQLKGLFSARKDA